MGEINHIMLANKRDLLHQHSKSPNVDFGFFHAWSDVDMSHIPVLMVHTRHKRWDGWSEIIKMIVILHKRC